MPKHLSTAETRDAATCRHCGCVDPLGPPAGVVVWVARDGDGELWMFANEPIWAPAIDEWMDANGTATGNAVIDGGRLAALLGEGLAPGECARVRITREESP